MSFLIYCHHCKFLCMKTIPDSDSIPCLTTIKTFLYDLWSHIPVTLILVCFTPSIMRVFIFSTGFPNILLLLACASKYCSANSANSFNALGFLSLRNMANCIGKLSKYCSFTIKSAPTRSKCKAAVW